MQILQSPFSYGNGILLSFYSKEPALRLFRQLLQLVESCRTVNVGSNEGNLQPLALVEFSELCSAGSFPASEQAQEQDFLLSELRLELAAQKRIKLFIHYAHYVLPQAQAGQKLFLQRPVLDLFC